jgi:uncharacterized membrane protein affecting hemolysin expression
MKRSQIISIDVMIALSIFLLVFIFFIWTWNSQITRFNQSNNNLELQLLSQHAAKVLLTQGVPSNWHEDMNPHILGLTAYDGRVLYDKVYALSNFTSSNYSEVKRLLGILGPKYELFIDVQLYDAGVYISNSTIGMIPENASAVAVTQRNILIDDTWGILRVLAWVRT